MSIIQLPLDFDSPILKTCKCLTCGVEFSYRPFKTKPIRKYCSRACFFTIHTVPTLLVNEEKVCECGCGQFTPIAKDTCTSTGRKKGQPMRLIKGHRRLAPIEVRFWAKVDKSSGPDACWLWEGPITQTGYGVRTINHKRKLAHRLAYEFTFGSIPEGLFVCHHCDNPPCVNPSHLFVGTAVDNIRDMIAKGRNSKWDRRGACNGNSRLVETNIKEIRRLYANGVYQTVIAKRYGITQTTVSAIIRRKAWAHI